MCTYMCTTPSRYTCTYHIAIYHIAIPVACYSQIPWHTVRTRGTLVYSYSICMLLVLLLPAAPAQMPFVGVGFSVQGDTHHRQFCFFQRPLHAVASASALPLNTQILHLRGARGRNSTSPLGRPVRRPPPARLPLQESDAMPLPTPSCPESSAGSPMALPRRALGGVTSARLDRSPTANAPRAAALRGWMLSPAATSSLRTWLL